ncbi:MAG: hypothetical protein Q8O40_12670, partial [Chloroflexota bacterium]|nr:hypothetical protein [Chloroflexota bacterium]
MSSRKDRRMLRSNLSRAKDLGRCSALAQYLYCLLVVNADDQGRLSGDPDTIKMDVCPRVKEIGFDDILGILQELKQQRLISVSTAASEPVIQLLQWWDEQAPMQWAYPSDHLPPEGWDDRLRFRHENKVITLNWPGAADGTTSVPLSELAERFAQQRSVALAIRKALDQPLPKGLPNALPNALGEALGKPSKQGEGEVKSKLRVRDLPGAPAVAPGLRAEATQGGGTTEAPKTEVLDDPNQSPAATQRASSARVSGAVGEKRSKRGGNPQADAILEHVEKAWGQPIPFWGKEARFVKQALGMGYVAEQILACWRLAQESPRWKGQWMPMASLL